MIIISEVIQNKIDSLEICVCKTLETPQSIDGNQ